MSGAFAFFKLALRFIELSFLTIPVELRISSGQTLKLTDVLYIPESSVRLISFSHSTKRQLHDSLQFGRVLGHRQNAT
jgi:hypothetical protein